jgi:hypothetical protein
MLALVSVFWDIVLLRRGPRDLPASGSLLVGVAAVYLATSVATARIGFGPSLAIVRGLLDIGILVGAFSMLLALRRRGHRLLQTLTALLGAGLVLAPPNMALVLAARAHPTQDGALLLLHFTLVLLLVWEVIVTGHIVREALDVPLFTGIAVATSYAALTIFIFLQLPTPPVT